MLAQIEHVLLDRERLLRRTQTRRSLYTVLGKQEQQPEPGPEPGPDTSVRRGLFPWSMLGDPLAGVVFSLGMGMEEVVSERWFLQCNG